MAATLVFGLLGAVAAYTIARFSSARSSAVPSRLDGEDTLTGRRPVATG
jgi:hypothetical protein